MLKILNHVLIRWSFGIKIFLSEKCARKMLFYFFGVLNCQYPYCKLSISPICIPSFPIFPKLNHSQIFFHSRYFQRESLCLSPCGRARRLWTPRSSMRPPRATTRGVEASPSWEKKRLQKVFWKEKSSTIHSDSSQELHLFVNEFPCRTQSLFSITPVHPKSWAPANIVQAHLHSNEWKMLNHPFQFLSDLILILSMSTDDLIFSALSLSLRFSLFLSALTLGTWQLGMGVPLKLLSKVAFYFVNILLALKTLENCAKDYYKLLKYPHFLSK